MSVQHSPAPWRIAGTDIVTDFFSKEVILAGVFSGGYTRNADKDRKRQRANARLISTAPELLDALRQLLARCDDTEACDDFPNECDRARRVIAKATS